MLSVYLCPMLHRIPNEVQDNILTMHESLDVEAQRGADSADVFVVELLEHCGLSGVIQASRGSD
jgi:hypothetical protein